MGYQEDSTILFTQFPVEVWLLITETISDREVLNNLSLASPVFRNILLPRMPEFLFPDVWKILGVKFETEKDEAYTYDLKPMYPKRKVTPPWYSKILILRRVCKVWCKGVDDFYENLPDNFKMRLDRHTALSSGNELGSWTHVSSFRNTDHMHISRFMRQFEKTHVRRNDKNPIVGRWMDLTFQRVSQQNRQIFNDLAALTMLETYGKHVWYSKLNTIDDFDYSHCRDRVLFYMRLRKILEYLPNVKTLDIKYTRSPRTGQDTYGVYHVNWCPLEDIVIDMDEEISLYPLPKLHQLEFVSVKNFPACIFNALIVSNYHITMLEVERDWFEDGYNLYTMELPNLKQLSIKYFSVEEFENLDTAQVNWSLEKLYLDLSRCPIVLWSSVFSILQRKWSTTLTNVAIHFPPIGNDVEEMAVIRGHCSLRLNLPNVERFKFTAANIFTLDFILPMKDTLKYLEVSVPTVRLGSSSPCTLTDQLRSLETGQSIRFVGFFKKFENSNIWELFPRLEYFHLSKSQESEVVYTRPPREENNAVGSVQPGPVDNLWWLEE